MPSDTNNAEVFHKLEEIAENTDHPRLNLVIDPIKTSEERENTAAVVAAGVDRSGPNKATIDLSLEFDDPVEVDLPDMLDEGTAYSQTGFVVTGQSGADSYVRAELRLTNVTQSVNEFPIGDVRSVERID